MGRSVLGAVPLARGTRWTLLVAALLAIACALVPAQASAARKSSHKTRHVRHHRHYKIRKLGELDCNGYSRLQHSVRRSMACTDIRGLKHRSTDWTWHGRFFDNGNYIGHDEPDYTFLSDAPNSGNDVTFTETLPRDPLAAPTVAKPGSDVTHWFELSVAPWFSMMMCDPSSYPFQPCEPKSDSNAPNGRYLGAGNAFMEMQFYPPGFAPFVDGISCDNTHWCSALNIDSLECTIGFVHCNPNCVEPVNFAYVTTDGVPGGPPSPQLANLDTFKPGRHTLLMNPGDRLQIHMYDALVPGTSQHAFEVVIKDLTTGETGSMQASARNGFQNTSIADCRGEPFNFEPEYNTARKQNISPWAALQTNISTQFEIGHFEACSSLGDKSTISLFGVEDTYWSHCNGPYESTTQPDGAGNAEVSDAFCFPAGDTHGMLSTTPDQVTGCVDNLAQNGDLDFDGSPYWADWPVSANRTDTLPGSFVQALATTQGRQYANAFIQTDAALSESTCTATTPSGCSVPPVNAPGRFYPYWTKVGSGSACTLEFGNVSSGPGVNPMGQDVQYGTSQAATLGYPEFEGPVMPNSC